MNGTDDRAMTMPAAEWLASWDMYLNLAAGDSTCRGFLEANMGALDELVDLHRQRRITNKRTKWRPHWIDSDGKTIH